MEEKKYKILLVDDDNFLLNMYSMKFTKAGMDVVCINDPLEALDKLRAGYTPDIAILDVVMPGIDGIELLSKIKEEKLVSNGIFIILSNQGQQSELKI